MAGRIEGQRRRWRPTRRQLASVLLVLVLWLIGCGITVFKAVADGRDGVAAARTAKGMISAADLVDGRALVPLSRAEDHFEKARRSLDRPHMAPLKVIPLLGRQIRSASALAGAAAEVSVAGRGAVSGAGAALSGPRATGPQRVALLRKLEVAAGGAARALAGVELGPRKGLLGPLAKRRAEIAEDLSAAREATAKARTVTGGLAGLLQGPHRYLVFGANNAEMRAGSGTFLTVGTLSAANGEMSLEGFTPSGLIGLDAGAAPPIEDRDFAARWGFLQPNRNWHNLGVSPRFPASAALGSAMWKARGGAVTDGVVALDPVALKALLGAIGPVPVGPRTVSSQTVVDLLLHDQYVGVGSDAGPEQAARRELLGLVAQATLTGVQRGGTDVAALAGALGGVAAGRHILAWAPDPATQRLWGTAGVDGTLGPRSLALSMINQGANKLDPFLEVSSRLVFHRRRNTTEVELRVDLRNRTPEGQSGYVFGDARASGLRPGDYLGLLSVNLPGAAEMIEVEGAPALAAEGRDGPTVVRAWQVRVDKGAAVSHVVRFELPGRHGRIQVEASARIPGVRWKAGGSSWESGAKREITW
ncbi:MAG TPA: DUF4012 domain-containing protein [Acidimicrobiales bacterium]|nr:DUF4012 domain-containing protein [Acidimicrobiales bacterium]